VLLKLLTREGGELYSHDDPKLATIPDVVFWGARCFVAQPDPVRPDNGTGKDALYFVEATPYYVTNTPGVR